MPWSEQDILDIKYQVAHGVSAEETASFLGRDVDELEMKIADMKDEGEL